MENSDIFSSFDIMERGHALRDAVLDGDLEQVKTAIETGTCLLNEGDIHGRTVLHLASCRGHVEMMRLFLENGADISAVDRHGNTALHWCGHIGAAECLLEMGADVFAVNKMNFTPRELAERRGVSKNVVQIFRHFEKDAEKQNLRTKKQKPSPKKETVKKNTKQAKGFVLPSIWYEFYCDIGGRNLCLLILGLLACSLYMAYVLTGLNLGYEDRIPLDQQTYKIRL